MNILLVVFADYLLTNLWWITALSVFFVIGLYLLIDFLHERNKIKKGKINVNRGLCLEALGGEGNLIDKKLEGSRIIIHLHDYSCINRDKLRDAGVTGFILKSDQLTLVIKENSLEVYSRIFPNG